MTNITKTLTTLTINQIEGFDPNFRAEIKTQKGAKCIETIATCYQLNGCFKSGIVFHDLNRTLATLKCARVTKKALEKAHSEFIESYPIESLLELVRIHYEKVGYNPDDYK